MRQTQDDNRIGPAGRTGWPWDVQAPVRAATLPDGRPWPRISVVTPSFKQGGFIEETIRSVLRQGYPNLEYFIMDGGSTDETPVIIRRYAGQLAGWVSEPDAGQTDAINKGLRRASGEILAYLNSDDLYLPGALHAVAERFVQHSEIGLLYGECQTIDAGGRLIGFLPRRGFSLRRLIQRGEFLPQQAVFWRRAAQEQVGLLDAGLRYAMDYDYFIRVARAFPVAYLPQPIAAFRMHGSSKTVSQSERHWREALAVSQRHGLRPWQLWYWLRRLRHWGLRALPTPLQMGVRRRLGRSQDPYLYAGDHDDLS